MVLFHQVPLPLSQASPLALEACSQSMGVDVLFFQGLCLLLSIVLTKSYHWYTVTSWLVQPPWSPKQFETHW